MPQWWKTLYERRFRDRAEWAIPENSQVKAQTGYVITATGLKPPAEILDLGAGTGRHVAHLAGKGYRAIGMEYSEVLVKKGLELSPGINLFAGDMKNLEDESRYDAVTFFDTSFGIFTDSENEDMLARSFNALKPGGWIAIDYMNPDFWKKKTAEMTTSNYRVKGDRFVRRYRYDESTFRLTDSGIYTSPDGASETYPDQVLALYPLDRLEAMLRETGFISPSWYGAAEYDYPDDLRPLSPESAFALCTAQKL